MTTQETFNAIYAEVRPVIEREDWRDYTPQRARTAYHGSERAAKGSVKRAMEKLKVGDSFPVKTSLERNGFYVVANRLKIKLQCRDGQMTRIA